MARIGIFLCHCGSNIAGTVDVTQVSQHAGSLDSVTVVRDYKFVCSEPGQDMIKQDIKDLGLNRVVVAACPRGAITSRYFAQAEDG